MIEHHPGVDRDLLGDCRKLVLAMAAAWRWDAGDQFPNGERTARAFVAALRDAPRPTLDAMTRRRAGP